MAKEVITRTLCDVHADRDNVKVDATFCGTDENPYANVIVIGGQRRAIDLCDECCELVNRLTDMLTQFGWPAEALEPPARRSPQPTQAGTKVFYCPEPNCTKVYQSASSLRSHRKDRHGVTSDGDLRCPECTRTFDRPQGLGAHRRSAHGVVGAYSH